MPREENLADPGPNDSGNARNIIRGIGSLSVQGILNAFMGYLLLAVFLRSLPAVEFGAYSSLQVIVIIVGAPSVLGLGSAVVKFLASGDLHTESWGSAKASLVLGIVFSGAASLALAASAPLLSAYFMKSTSWSWIFYLGAVWLFAQSLSTITRSVLQAVRRYTLLAGVLFVSRLVATAVGIAGILVYRSLAMVVISWVVYGVLVSAAVLWTTWSPLISSSPKNLYRPVLKYATPLGIAATVTQISANADIVIVGGYLDPTSLGIYNAAVAISAMLSALFVVPLTTALFAETSHVSHLNENVAMGVKLALRFSAFTVLPASFLSAAMAAQLLTLISGGGTYTAGIPLLQIINLMYIFFAVETIVLYALQGVGRTKEVLVAGTVTATADICISLAVVPLFGLQGAAASRVTVMIIGCGISLYYARKYLSVFGDFVFVAKAFVSSAVPAFAIFALSEFFSSALFTLLPYSVLAIALFLLVEKSLKLITQDDKLFLERALPLQLKWISRLL